MDISEFKKLMTDPFISNETVKEMYGLQADRTFDEAFSAVSIENILFSDVATGMFVMHELFEQFKKDVSATIKEQASGTAEWYAHKARQFRFGAALVPETDYYDDTGLTGEQIEAMRVVKYAAAVEARDRSVLYVKVAGGSDDDRHPLTDAQLTAFKSYLNAVQYAGVLISVINDPPDDIRLTIDIYYDATLLDEHGKRLDGTGDTTVQDAIRNYLNNLPFNGMYTNQGLTDVLQAVPGVDIAEIKSAASRHGSLVNYTEINAHKIAHAGYYTASNLTLNFIASEELL
jgi:hypothetical protein